ncbi:MAG TPA: FMN-binding negative transcriptional regulator, partial [Aeromicrobium sp.]|nr:FMN-binding negative transcriptional regulator [Aeromicrobium sp.]
ENPAFAPTNGILNISHYSFRQATGQGSLQIDDLKIGTAFTDVAGANTSPTISPIPTQNTPAWYASKAEHGRVVPTWNYSAVHLTGSVEVHDDLEWVRMAVTKLTERHEASRSEPWAVTDAPDRFINGQLKAIVGIEMTVTGVEAKSKLSQNRSDADRAGVIAGLTGEGGAREAIVADQMRARMHPPDLGPCR